MILIGSTFRTSSYIFWNNLLCWELSCLTAQFEEYIIYYMGEYILPNINTSATLGTVRLFSADAAISNQDQLVLLSVDARRLVCLRWRWRWLHSLDSLVEGDMRPSLSLAVSCQRLRILDSWQLLFHHQLGGSATQPKNDVTLPGLFARLCTACLHISASLQVVISLLFT